MHWTSGDSDPVPAGAGEVFDVYFPVAGQALPCEHAEALAAAVRGVLPWFGEDAGHGLHPVHSGPTAHGWLSPEDAGEEFMYLSRRARLGLRLPSGRLEDAAALQGRTLDIAGCAISLGAPEARPLHLYSALYARRVAAEPDLEFEAAFIEWAAAEISALGVRCRKLLAGRAHSQCILGAECHTWSLLVADLNAEESLRLQSRGIGPGRRMGLGLFMPHKEVRDVTQPAR